MKLLNLISQVLEFNCVFGMPTETIAMRIDCKTFSVARLETKSNGCRYKQLCRYVSRLDIQNASIYTGYRPIDFNHCAGTSVYIARWKPCLRHVL